MSLRGVISVCVCVQMQVCLVSLRGVISVCVYVCLVSRYDGAPAAVAERPERHTGHRRSRAAAY